MKNGWRFNVGWLMPMWYLSDELDVGIVTINAEPGKPSYAPTGVSVTDPASRISYWVSTDKTRLPEVRHKEPCLPGHFLYDLAEKEVYHMRPEDRDRMLKLMRKAISFNQFPLPDWAKELWDAALALVRGANVTSERILIRSYTGWEECDFGGEIGKVLFPRTPLPKIRQEFPIP